MIQPSVYSREQVIDKALELVWGKGYPNVITRSITIKIGPSTMPIYSHVSSLDDSAGKAFYVKGYTRRRYI